ncbi:unnamed protein product [Amoebophrya sp. A25]|nr:unnamed protein product [Amoebophrya sp. A25]|eukprot:GSA25T00026725001.1
MTASPQKAKEVTSTTALVEKKPAVDVAGATAEEKPLVTSSATEDVKSAPAATAPKAEASNKGEKPSNKQNAPVVVVTTTASAPIVRNLLPAIPAEKEDNLSYNLSDLTAFDLTPLEEFATTSTNGKVAAHLGKKFQTHLLSHTRDNVQLLMNKVFTSLPQESAETGTIGILRGHYDSPKDAFRLPRQKPCPSKKEMTRWEKFAKERNIHKRKKSKLVFDETTGGWSRRYGYKSAKQNAEKAQWCIEVKEGADATEDPFKKQKAEKKLVVAKQKLREMRNKVEQAGFKLAPAQLEKTGDTKVGANSKRGKEGLSEALKRAQVSSGSRGKFDKRKKGEELVKKRGGKKKLVGGNDKKTERDAVLKTFDKVTGPGRDIISSKKGSGMMQASKERADNKGVVKGNKKQGGSKRRSKAGGRKK